MKRSVFAVALIVAMLLSACATKPPETTGKSDSTLLPIDLGSGLTLTALGSYTGSYVEDGKDEAVTAVMSADIRNDGDQTVLQAAFTLTMAGVRYSFTLSTLPPGATVRVLDLQRRSAATALSAISTELTNFTAFSAEPSMYPDIFQVTGTDQAITIKNISPEDISGDIYIYYKTAYNDVFMGGITYRVRVSGLGAGESQTGYAGHYKSAHSKLMFITYAQ